MRYKLRHLTGIILLIFSISSVSAMAAEKKSDAAGAKYDGSSYSKSQASFCKEVSKMFKNGTIKRHITERVDIPVDVDPRGSEYLNLDIDGDGIADKVTVSSGSEGESLLEIQLSSGGVYAPLHEGGFIMIVKIKEQMYALVTYWEWGRQPDGSRKGKKVGYRLYELTKHGAELVCDGRDS